MATKATLKSYFETGDTPTQAQFSTLIDSLLGIDEEVADNLATDSGVKALAARQGVALKAIVDALGIRVGSIEELNSTTLQDYLLRADLGGFLAGKSDITHTHLASSITDLLDLVYTKTQVQDLIKDYTVESHTHTISDVSGLQTALDNANDQSLVATTRTELEGQISGKSDSGHSHTESDISDLKNYLESATATVLLQQKAEISHTHNESQITDLDKYTKAEVNSLFAGVVSDGSVPAHTHTESNISDLDKYTKAEVDQKVTDSQATSLNSHIAQSNPHSIGKADVGLGNVENLSKSELLDDPTLTGDITVSGNITGLTKEDVGLGNVPNSNVLDLFTSHLNDESNPHKVELSDFDAYTKAEVDSRVQEFIEIYRTVHTGTLPQEGTGSTGLVTQRDIWDRIKDIDFSSDTTTIDGNAVINGTLEVEGDVSFGNTNITNTNVSISTTLNVSGQVSLGSGLSTVGDVSIGGGINVSGSTVLQGLRATTIVGESIDAGSGLIQTTGNVSAKDLQIDGNLTAVKDDLVLKASADNKKVSIDDDLVVTGNLTVNGTTTSIDTTNLLIEDNIVVLNKNQTGTPENTLKSGIEVERGASSNVKLYFDEASGRWKAQIFSGSNVVTKTIAFVEDAYSQE